MNFRSKEWEEYFGYAEKRIRSLVQELNFPVHGVSVIMIFALNCVGAACRLGECNVLEDIQRTFKERSSTTQTVQGDAQHCLSVGYESGWVSQEAAVAYFDVSYRLWICSRWLGRTMERINKDSYSPEWYFVLVVLSTCIMSCFVSSTTTYSHSHRLVAIMCIRPKRATTL